MFVRFGVPMIYPYSMVNERFGTFAQYYLLNPLAEAVLLFQRAFWVGVPEEGMSRAEIVALHMPDHLLLRGGAMLAASLVLLVVAQLVFSRFENKVPERL